MARETKYNNITSPELLEQVNKDNISLKDEFLSYLQSIDRAKTTIYQYDSDLKIFFVWNLQFNDNKDFIKITKRELTKFQNHMLNVWEWSPKRIRRVKATISSMSNFIENILDEEPEYQDFKSIVKKIESPVNETVREKTVFEPEELQQLLDILVENKKYEQACALSLAMQSGRRKSELPRFKVSYFDEKNIMYNSLYITPEKVVTKGRGSKGKLLTLYVFKKEFDPYLNLWLKERKELGIESDWLFPKKENGIWIDEQTSVDTFNSWATTFTKLLGKDFYWHSVRHYWTTQTLKKLPANVVKELSGWSDLNLVDLYDDSTINDTLSMYFDEKGFKEIKQQSLQDL